MSWLTYYSPLYELISITTSQYHGALMKINGGSLLLADWPVCPQHGAGVPQGDILAPLSNECIAF